MTLNDIQGKIVSLSEAAEKASNWKSNGAKIVWTNGCFDILHYGHLAYLAAASDLGNKLIIGINSDQSIQKLKGSNRPVIDQKTRLLKIAAMQMVDLVTALHYSNPARCPGERG